MRKEIGMSVALLVMCGIIALSNNDFYGSANVINTSRQIAMVGVFAIGVGFVIITGGIDLSVGSVIGLTGVIIAKISAPPLGGAGMPIWFGVLVAMTVAVTIGLIQGFMITRMNLQPFIVTLGGMLLLRGISQTICHGGTISFGDSPFRNLADEGIMIGNVLIQYPIIVFLIVALVAAYVLHFTVFGRHIFAIGGNREAAMYSGIDVRNVEMFAYVISAGLAGLAGVVYAAYVGRMSHNVGMAYELIAIASAVLGGCSLRGGEGTVLGIFIGSAIMKVIENGINMFKITYRDAENIIHTWRLDTNWRNIVIGAVILGAVILDHVMHKLQERKKKKAVQSLEVNHAI